MNQNIEKAIEIAGCQAQLASMGNFTKSSVSYWLSGKRNISADNAVQLEKATGGQMDRSDFRPDLWPPDRWRVVRREADYGQELPQGGWHD